MNSDSRLPKLKEPLIKIYLMGEECCKALVIKYEECENFVLWVKIPKHFDML